MDSRIAGLGERVGSARFVVGLRGCNKEDCDQRPLVVGIQKEDWVGGIAWLSIHGKTPKSWKKWDWMSEEVQDWRIARGETQEKEAKDRTHPGGEETEQYG